MTLTGFKAISADIDSKRVIKLHFDHEVTDGDRQALVDAINMQIRYDRLRAAAQEACDLLAERTYGSEARSPGHNARLRLEAALKE